MPTTNLWISKTDKYAGLQRLWIQKSSSIHCDLFDWKHWIYANICLNFTQWLFCASRMNTTASIMSCTVTRRAPSWIWWKRLLQHWATLPMKGKIMIYTAPILLRKQKQFPAVNTLFQLLGSTCRNRLLIRFRSFTRETRKHAKHNEVSSKKTKLLKEYTIHSLSGISKGSQLGL